MIQVLGFVELFLEVFKCQIVKKKVSVLLFFVPLLHEPIQRCLDDNKIKL